MNNYGVAQDNGVFADDNGEVDLDALLADSIQREKDLKFIASDARRKAEQAKKEAKQKELAKANEWKGQYTTKKEWIPKAAVAIFHTQRCIACGTNHTHFMGVFQRQYKANDGISGAISSEQWVRAIDSSMIDGLPKEQKVTSEPVDMCECCAVSLGYPAQLYL